MVYQSKQSYYDLLKAGGLTWHQTQAVNPQRDEPQVLQKREAIKKKLEARKPEILLGEVLVFAEDECHLVWGDTIDFVWGQRHERTEVPIVNAKERQTYYDVMNLVNQEVTIAPHECGNGENTVGFIKHLQALYPNKKLIIIWDGATSPLKVRDNLLYNNTIFKIS